MESCKSTSVSFQLLWGLWLISVVIPSVNGFRPLKDRQHTWHDEWPAVDREEHDFGPSSSWNITGTYRGHWMFLESSNSSFRFRDFRKSSGSSNMELVSTTTKITGVHYVQGVIVFHDALDNENDFHGSQVRVEGVYIWPFRQLRMVAASGKENDVGQGVDYILSNPYHLLGLFSSQVFQESPQEKIWKRKHSPLYKIDKHCNTEIAAQISRISSRKDGDQDKYYLEGLIQSPSVDDDADCFSPMLLNATSINVEVYYNKAINYSLMVTFISFLEVLLLMRQLEHSNTQSGASKVSLMMVGHQAIMDAYLCLLHLTAGILVESLFNAFATAAFFKFVVFSIFEMRYLLAIWKAHRPHMNNGENWDAMRRELSVLYSRFYGILLGGILIMYEFHKFLKAIVLFLHSFWIHQIVTNVIRDLRKPLHPHYVLGMSITRMAFPLYAFSCPHNFMRIAPDHNWCMALAVFVGLQASILLVQYYFGSRCFIPRQILPEKYSYYRRLNQGPGMDCVICMTPIDLMQRSGDCMVTPCDHFFHSGCLQRWMDIKMECPTCRRPLPPA